MAKTPEEKKFHDWIDMHCGDCGVTVQLNKTGPYCPATPAPIAAQTEKCTACQRQTATMKCRRCPSLHLCFGCSIQHDKTHGPAEQVDAARSSTDFNHWLTRIHGFKVGIARNSYTVTDLESAWNAARNQRFNVIGASPVCVDCHFAKIVNCSHFDNCDGKWVYKTASLKQETQPPNGLEGKVRKAFEDRWKASAGIGYYPGSRSDIPQRWREWWLAMQAFIPIAVDVLAASSSPLETPACIGLPSCRGNSPGYEHISLCPVKHISQASDPHVTPAPADIGVVVPTKVDLTRVTYSGDKIPMGSITVSLPPTKPLTEADQKTYDPIAYLVHLHADLQQQVNYHDWKELEHCIGVLVEMLASTGDTPQPQDAATLAQEIWFAMPDIDVTDIGAVNFIEEVLKVVAARGARS